MQVRVNKVLVGESGGDEQAAQLLGSHSMNGRITDSCQCGRFHPGEPCAIAQPSAAANMSEPPHVRVPASVPIDRVLPRALSVGQPTSGLPGRVEPNPALGEPVRIE